MQNNSKTTLKKTKIPKELNELLIEFVIKVLEENPSNLLSFAAEYFNNKNRKQMNETKKDSNNNKAKQSSNMNKPSIEKDKENNQEQPPSVNFRKRRASISAEPYDPEKDKTFRKIVNSKSDEEKSRLIELVQNVVIFKSLDDEQINDIVNAMELKKVKENQVIIEQDAEGDYFYIIEKGTYEAYTRENPKKLIYENTGYFGELALLYNQPRAATVVALTDGEIWQLEREIFRRTVLQIAFNKRKLYENMLKNCDLLKNLNSYERMTVADALNNQKFSNGDCIIKQNDNADCMYFVISGEVEIYVEKNESIKLVKVCKAGDYFGELALKNNQPRAASAYAKGNNVVLAVLPKDAFERLIGTLDERE